MNSHRFPLAAIVAGLLAIVAAATAQPVFAQGASSTQPAMKETPPLPASEIPEYIKKAINSPERPAADHKLDAGRRPEQMMAFYGIKPGMKVADLSAAGGWMTEVLALTVGPTGTVYSQNAPMPSSAPPRMKRMLDAWHKRLARPALKHTIPVMEPFASDNLLPVKPDTLDAVFIDLNYHDLVGHGVNVEKMNASVFKDLKHGGVYAVIDHSAKPGTGASDAATLHRIDENFVIAQVEKAGFKLAATSSALRHPNDPRTEKSFLMHGHDDRFMLKFVKP